MEPLLGVVFSSAGVLHHSRREESGRAHQQKKAQHVSVMTEEVVRFLSPQKGEVVVDGTYGVGGHSKALKAAAKIKLISLDADPAAGVIEANFGDIEEVLEDLGVTKVDKVLFDLGWNRGQLADGRGFSFMQDEPLLMSYSPKPRSGFTAAEILNTWKESVLADVIFGYGEERYARRIAKAIVERRALKPIETTIELVEIIRDAVPASYRHQKLHFATRTFQALRIAVNDELKVIEQGVAGAWKKLSCGGRIGIISFHSTEDRVVKKLFADLAKKDGTLLFKKPLTPGALEIKSNPSARSAKLRVIEKTCTR